MLQQDIQSYPTKCKHVISVYEGHSFHFFYDLILQQLFHLLYEVDPSEDSKHSSVQWISVITPCRRRQQFCLVSPLFCTSTCLLQRYTSHPCSFLSCQPTEMAAALRVSPATALVYPSAEALNLGSPQTSQHLYVWLQSGDKSRWLRLRFRGKLIIYFGSLLQHEPELSGTVGIEQREAPQAHPSKEEVFALWEKALIIYAFFTLFLYNFAFPLTASLLFANNQYEFLKIDFRNIPTQTITKAF